MSKKKSQPIKQARPKPQKQQKARSAQLENPGRYLSTNNKPSMGIAGSLSKCAARYALAITDPFHPAAKNACVPRAPSANSLKTTAINRFQCVIGTAGVGFVTIHPTVANDVPAFFTSTSAYTGTGVTLLTASNTLSTGVTLGNLNSAYPATSLTALQGASNVQGRIVSVGCRMTYTGTTLNESGTYTCYTSPAHDSVLPLSSSVASLGSIVDVTVENITRDPCSVRVFGIDDSETSFSNSLAQSINPVAYPFSQNSTSLNGFTYSVNGVLVGSPVSIIMVTGVAGSTFQGELVAHLEYCGPAAAALASLSEADIVGYETVQAAAARLPAYMNTTHDRKNLRPFELIMEIAGGILHELKPIAISSFVKFGAAMLL